MEKEPWERFLIPCAKSDRLVYFNSITKAVYQSAFVGKQSGFRAYLDGQRKFRYDVTIKSKHFQNITASYEEAIIPKDNIAWKRYLQFPSDVKFEDVGKCARAVEHFNGTIKLLNELQEQLSARKRELYGENMEPKSWATDELNFLKDSSSVIDKMVGGTEQKMHDVQYILTQLEKRFDESEVRKCEKRRRNRRDKENRSKL